MPTLKKRARDYSDRLLLSVGARLVKAADREAIEECIRQCRPWTTEHELLRIGGDSDGGYLVPDDLEGLAAVYSPGVADVADFEAYFADRGVPCYLVDASVEGPPIEHPLFHFERKFLGNRDSERYVRLGTWVEAGPPGDLLLQMDIEGAEYEVLADVDSQILERFRIIVVEFHTVDRILHEDGLDRFRSALANLLRHHTIVHIHPNNADPVIEACGLQIPRLLEITLLRTDRISERSPTTTFPHALDQPNVAGADAVLPRCWHQ